MNELTNGAICLAATVYEKWDQANRDWIKQHGSRASFADLRTAGPDMFRKAVGPYLQMLADIDSLRAEEGDSLTIVCDNPDFNGLPNNTVDCCGDWTDWKDRRFTGNTLAEALRAAAVARAKEGATK